MELRPYQEEAITAAIDHYEQEGPSGSGLLYLATGAGKTVIAAELSRRIGGPILFLVHREELAIQTIEKYQAVWKGVDVGLVKAQSNELGRTVTVASVQTVTNQKRLDQLIAANAYKMIIQDEAHHSPSPTFERVLTSVPAYRLGLTATPNRSDEAAIDKLFSKVLYKYTIIDGIKDGYLSDIEARRIDIGINLDGVKVTAGDFAAQAISDVMCHPDVMQVIYEKWKEYGSDRKTVIFCCDVNHAKEMSAYFGRQGISADWIAGEMDSETRKATLKKFSRGQSQVLCNCMILTEGWDEPAVDCVVMARPTSSQSLYIQASGRGLRTFPGKENCLILDVVGNTRKHQLMQVPILTGIPYPKAEATESTGTKPRVIKSVKDVLVAQDEAVDIYKKAPRTFNWIRSGDRFGLQLGFNHYLQVRPTDGGYEAVNCYLKGWKYTETVIHQSHMIDLCISMAEEQAENLAARSSNNVLEYQTVDKTLRINSPSQKQVALLNKYGIPVPPTAMEAARLISRAFFDFFLKSAECTADSDVRKLIKQEKYANRLSCSITLEQIDNLKVIEAGKIMKFYTGGQKYYGYRKRA